MTLWCVMLISQGLLIRFKKFSLHKLIGKASYLMVPLILISGANAAHHLLSGVADRMPPENFYSNFALMFNSLLVFGIIYGLAIYHRKKPLIHARFMICTIFPILTPLTDRLVHHYARPILSLLPSMNNSPMVWLVGFVIADLLLIGLLIWDARVHKKWNVFPLVLGLVGLYHLSVISFYHFSFWRSLADWIMSFPLS
jgi:hypothetical protein